MARTGQPPGGTAASDTGTGAAGSTGFRGAVDVVVAIVVVVDVLVLLVAVGTAGCPPETLVVVDATVVVDDGRAVALVVPLLPVVLDDA
jgi:hypothetical protein